MTPTFQTRMRGFSLVELMVSIVIGLLAVLFATRIMTDSERNKDAALGGADSMQNGMLAMFQISADAEQAGYGINDPLLNGCDTQMSDSQDYVLAPATRASATIRPLAAAVIEADEDGSDRVTLYSGNAEGGTATLRVTKNYLGGSSIDVDRRPYGFSKGDVIVVAPEQLGGRCALAQISVDPQTQSPPPAQQTLRFNDTAQRFNTGALGVVYDGNTARLFNLGQGSRLSFHTWSVEKGFLRLRATDMAGAGEASLPVADNIVALKAQYGFDTRGSTEFEPGDGTEIGAWSSTMIDADGDGAAGGAGDYGRIVALRLAVVARAKNPERPGADGKCKATLAAPTVFGAEMPTGVDPVEVTIDPAVAGDAIGWQCYRYRVFETIVPLRNALWRPA